VSVNQIELGQLIKAAKLIRAENKSFPILSMTMHAGLVDQADKFKKRVASIDTAPYKVVRRNQLVVGFPIDEGVLSFQELHDEAIVSPAYDVWDIRDERKIETKYLERFLRSPHALAFYASKLRGTTARRRTLPDDIFLSLLVPVPLLAEQRRITEVLARAEALRAKRHAALAQLDTLAQSIFLDLFGDPARNPQGWPLSTIGGVSDQVTDGEHLTPKRTTKGIKLLSARNIRDGYLDFQDVDYVEPEEYERIKRRCNPSPGDVLISCSGTIGRVALVETNESFALVRSVALVRPKNSIVASKFLEHYLRTTTLKARMLRRANASSQANLFQGQIRELPVYLPPVSRQQDFARRAASVEKLRLAHHASLAELDALFAVLQHRAFRGEL
jgi:type I restriction enzyme S subunit